MSEQLHTWYGVVFKDGGISSLWPSRDLAEMEIQTFCIPHEDIEIKEFRINLSSEPEERSNAL